MIIEREKKLTNVMSGQGQSQQMTIDAASLAHIMQVLTNLYSDPELAVIREYTTNASDSHVAAGRRDTPIEVTFPTVFDPAFIVKDSGVGLDSAEVFNVFGAYGASTKRDTNDQVGALGLGCKSALTYTKQFSLTAIKNGKKRVYSVHLDEFGVGKITELSSRDTDEHNGVEINIPVKEVSSFLEKARKFFTFYGYPVKFHNASDKFLASVKLENFERIELTEDTTFYQRLSYDYDNRSDMVVMGGVAYPIDRRQLGANGNAFGSGVLVIDAPIGAVQFTPNRESLHYTESTKAFIRAKTDESKAVYLERLLAKASDASDIREAHSLLTANYQDIRTCKSQITKDFYYQDFRLLDTLGNILDYDIPNVNFEVLQRQSNRKGDISYVAYEGYNHGLLRLNQSFVNEALLVEFGAGEELNGYSRGVLRQYLLDVQEKTPQYIFLIKHDYEFPKAISPLMPEKQAYSALKEKVLAYRREARAPNGTAQKNAPTYPDLYSGLNIRLDENEPIVYSYTQVEVNSNSYRRSYSYHTLNNLGVFDEAQYVYIAGNRKDRFHKLFPKAVSLDTYLVKKVSESAATLTDAECEIVGNLLFKAEAENWAMNRMLNRFRFGYGGEKKFIDRIEDEDVVEIINVFTATNVPTKIATLASASYLIGFSSKNGKMIEDRKEKLAKKFQAIRTKYPLIFQDEDTNFWVNYINERRGE